MRPYDGRRAIELLPRAVEDCGEKAVRILGEGVALIVERAAKILRLQGKIAERFLRATAPSVDEGYRALQ